VTQDITQDEYREFKSGYEAKIADLTAKEKELRNTLVERLAQETATANAAANLFGVQSVTDLTADSLDRLVDRILVFEDKHIEVHYKFTDGLVIGNTVNREGGEDNGHDSNKQAG
jgi:hypothetical protein